MIGAVHGMEAKRKTHTARQDEFRGYKILLHTAGEMIQYYGYGCESYLSNVLRVNTINLGFQTTDAQNSLLVVRLVGGDKVRHGEQMVKNESNTANNKN